VRFVLIARMGISESISLCVLAAAGT